MPAARHASAASAPSPYRQHLEGALTASIGAQGASDSAMNAALARVPSIATALREQADAGTLPVLTLPDNPADLPEIERWAERIRYGFSHLVVMGTGGSSLGGMMLCQLRQPRFIGKSIRVHFVDNTDPDTMQQLLSQLPLADSFFLAISKSGSTAETMVQMLLVVQALKAQGQAIRSQALVITMPGERPLRHLAEHFHIPTLDHDAALGGRFSVLSSVGLLPAAVAGLDITALRAGAAHTQAAFWQSPESSAPAQGAALQYSLLQAGKNISIVMPYADRLSDLGRWYQQLWAESIGKSGHGSTPVRALGAVDQHSQLQLYLDGPRDKLITMLWLQSQGTGERIDPALAAELGMDYLGGHPLGNVIAAQQRGTAESLRRGGVPVRVIELFSTAPTKANASAGQSGAGGCGLDFAIGGLLQHFMLETIVMAGLLGVNAFDQPAVEESKELALNNLQAMR